MKKNMPDTLVLTADSTCLSDSVLFKKGYALIPQERREKIENLHIEKERNLSLAASLLLRFGLEKFGIFLRDGDIVLDNCGKPFLKNRGNFFNLSHSGIFSMCVISQNEVGCDVQKMENNDHLRTAERFFSAEEYENLIRLPEDERAGTFYRYWVLKESYMKALGKGFTMSPSSFTVSLGDTVSVSSCGGKDTERHFYEYDGIPGYRCAVCVCGAGDVRFRTIDLKDKL